MNYNFGDLAQLMSADAMREDRRTDGQTNGWMDGWMGRQEEQGASQNHGPLAT